MLAPCSNCEKYVILAHFEDVIFLSFIWVDKCLAYFKRNYDFCCLISTLRFISRDDKHRGALMFEKAYRSARFEAFEGLGKEYSRVFCKFFYRVG